MEKDTPFDIIFKQLRKPIIWVALVSAAINLLMLVGPIYMLLVYDLVLPSRSSSILFGLFCAVLLAMVVFGALLFVRAHLGSKIQMKFDQFVGGQVFGHWLDEAITNKTQSQNSLADLDHLRLFASGPVIFGIFDLPWVPIFLAATFYIHPWLGWLTLLGAGAGVALTVLNWRISQKPIVKAQIDEINEKEFRESVKKNADAVRGLGMEQNVTQHWLGLRVYSNKANYSSSILSDAFSSVSKSFRMALQSALLTVGAYLAIIDEITPGMIIASTIIASRALAPLDQIIGNWRSIGRAIESYRRLQSIFDNASDDENCGPSNTLGIGLNVTGIRKTIQNMSPKGKPITLLQGIDFSLSSGEGLAIVGNSASGKTSLARLIAGIEKPDEGTVFLDGRAVTDELSKASIGYLPQNVDLFPGTIAQNIARYDRNAEDQDIIDAAKLAGVHKLILTLPLGYSTIIGMDQKTLSGGQIQRIGLARSIYKKPKLLVLDEPNSNLDASGETVLKECIQAMLRSGSIVVVVVHRPSIVSALDKILVMQQGAIIGFGTTKRIVRKKGMQAKVDSNFDH